MGYCPKCRSLLYPGDQESMDLVGVCSGCVTYDKTPGKSVQAAFDRAKVERAKKLGKGRITHQMLQQALYVHGRRPSTTEEWLAEHHQIASALDSTLPGPVPRDLVWRLLADDPIWLERVSSKPRRRARLVPRISR